MPGLLAETLHEHGAEERAPGLLKQIEKRRPPAFPDPWQSICSCVRAWIIKSNS